MSKLYYLAMNHSYLMLRKIAPKNTEMQEGTWSQDRKDFSYVHEKRIEEVMIFKNSIRNYFKSINIKSHNPISSIKDDNPLPNEIVIEDWMIKDERGEYKTRFTYLMKLLADIPGENIEWKEEQILFNSSYKPGEGPSDMILPFDMSEEEIFVKIEERMNQRGKCEQIKSFFRNR